MQFAARKVKKADKLKEVREKSRAGATKLTDAAKHLLSADNLRTKIIELDKQLELGTDVLALKIKALTPKQALEIVQTSTKTRNTDFIVQAIAKASFEAQLAQIDADIQRLSAAKQVAFDFFNYAAVKHYMSDGGMRVSDIVELVNDRLTDHVAGDDMRL